MIVKCSYAVPYDIAFSNAIEMYKWCEENFGEDNIRILYRTIYFNKQEHYNWFMLRWS